VSSAALDDSSALRPRHANAGRGETFRMLIGGRGAAYALVLGGAAAVVYGAYRGRPLVMLGGPVLVALVVVVTCAVMADRLAAERFFSSFARAHGLDYARRWELLSFTPLLGAADVRWCEHWMSGEVCHDPALTGGIGHFVFERKAQWSENELGIRQTHEITHEHRRLTLGMLDIEASIPWFHGVFLHPRQGLLGALGDWLDDPPSHDIEVESTALTERYRLRLADEQDELRARRLLAPSLVDWLANHPLVPGFELRGGTLVVFTHRVLNDTGNLEFFLEAVRELGGRVVREVAE
jgi:hypothetical protein